MKKKAESRKPTISTYAFFLEQEFGMIMTIRESEAFTRISMAGIYQSYQGSKGYSIGGFVFLHQDTNK
jgi:hypothetical protein